MATNRWRGDAIAVAQVKSVTIGGTPAAADTFSITINGKALTFAVPASPLQSNAVAASGGSLTTGTTYYWVITAVFAYGETVVSNEKSLAISTPNLTANLSWAAVTGATGYNVYRSTTSGTYGATSLVTGITGGSTLTYSDTGAALVAGSPPANDINITAGGLQATVSATGVNIPKEFQEITWTVSGAVITATAATAGIPFTISVSKSSSGGTITLASATTSSGPNDVNIAANWSTGALPGSTTAGPASVPTQNAASTALAASSFSSLTYYWVITATTQLGETTVSNEESLAMDNSHQANLSWNAVTHATGYKIYRSTTSGTYGASSLVATIASGATVTYQDPGAATTTGTPPGSNTANYYVADDVVFEDTSSSALYNLDQLSAYAFNSLTFNPTFTGTIGLPLWNASGYYEYRPTYFVLSPTTLTLAAGVGSGSGRVKIDCNNSVVTGLVNQTGTPAERGLGALLVKNTASGSVFSINKGSVGFAQLTGDTTTISTLNVGYISNVQGDVTAVCGSGTTLTTVNQAGGTFTSFAAISGTVTKSDGTLTMEAGTWSTLNCFGGKIYPKAAGTFATTNLYAGALLDLTQDLRATKTFTNLTLNKGCSFIDSNKVAAFTNPFLVNCALSDITLDLGTDFHLQRS